MRVSLVIALLALSVEFTQGLITKPDPTSDRHIQKDITKWTSVAQEDLQTQAGKASTNHEKGLKKILKQSSQENLQKKARKASANYKKGLKQISKQTQHPIVWKDSKASLIQQEETQKPWWPTITIRRPDGVPQDKISKFLNDPKELMQAITRYTKEKMEEATKAAEKTSTSMLETQGRTTPHSESLHRTELLKAQFGKRGKHTHTKRGFLGKGKILPRSGKARIKKMWSDRHRAAMYERADHILNEVDDSPRFR